MGPHVSCTFFSSLFSLLSSLLQASGRRRDDGHARMPAAGERRGGAWRQSNEAVAGCGRSRRRASAAAEHGGRAAKRRRATGGADGGEEAGTTTSRVTDMRAAFPWQTWHEAWDKSHMSPSSTALRQTTHSTDAVVFETSHPQPIAYIRLLQNSPIPNPMSSSSHLVSLATYQINKLQTA
uniref:Uncharacterized protein n=1 Tax=Oryza sativa subsp. japonica TaxID=39947 RepID=Q69LH9_ORYSJ|nr:hypothetical protein [Oryza sativa Japonica Group]